METAAQLERPALTLDVEGLDAEVTGRLVAGDDAADGRGDAEVGLANMFDDFRGQGGAEALAERTGPVLAAVLDHDDRARHGIRGQPVADGGARPARGLGLQRREPEARVRIPRDEESHRAAAEVADAVEQDDGGLLRDGRLPTG